MTRSACRWGGCVLAVVLWCVAGAASEGAIPQPPGATTREDFTAASWGFNTATLVEAYREKGARDPKWDGEAEAFLRGVADYWSNPKRTVAAADQVAALGDRAVELGCTDPLVLYCLARVGSDASDAERRKATYAERVLAAPDALKARGYPAYRVYGAAGNARRLRAKDRNQRPEAERLLTLQIQELARTLVETKDRAHQRALAAPASEFLEEQGDDRATLERIIAAVESAPAEPWLRDFVLGVAHTKLAWTWRGNGWAAEVAEQGWQGFHEHLAKARRHLEAAWKLDPTRPEPAHAMLAVAMGLSDDAAVEMRQWFERAVSAQFDYEKAYNAYLWGIYPRWHGSHRAMYAFGLECAETGRFETDVPWEFIDALLAINSDADEHGHELWRAYGAYPHVKKVLEAYAAHPKTQWNRAYHLSHQLCFAVACQEWSEAERILAALDEVGGQLNAEALRLHGTSRDKLISTLYEHVGPSAPRIQEATRLGRSGQMQRSLEMFEALEREGVEPAGARRLVQSRADALRWRLAFDAGDTVRLPVSEGLDGWRLVEGAWQVKDGALEGTASGKRMAIAFERLPSASYELTGRVEFGPSPSNERQAVVYTVCPPERERQIQFDPRATNLRIGYVYDKEEYRDVDAQVPNDAFGFRVRVDEGAVSVWIDDRPVVLDYMDAGLAAHGIARIGFGGCCTEPGTVIRFRDLAISAIAPPAAPEPVRREGPPPAPR